MILEMERENVYFQPQIICILGSELRCLSSFDTISHHQVSVIICNFCCMSDFFCVSASSFLYTCPLVCFALFLEVLIFT
jgi:hypothetical protein